MTTSSRPLPSCCEKMREKTSAFYPDVAWANEFDAPIVRDENECIMWFEDYKLYFKFCPWCGKKALESSGK